jgi:hypothetical protein
MSIAAQYLVTAVIGVKGTNVTYSPEYCRVPGYPRANTLREDSLVDSLVRDAIGPGKRSAAGTAGGRPLAWDGCAGHCRPCAAGGSARGPARPTRPVRLPQ